MLNGHVSRNFCSGDAYGRYFLKGCCCQWLGWRAGQQNLRRTWSTQRLISTGLASGGIITLEYFSVVSDGGLEALSWWRSLRGKGASTVQVEDMAVRRTFRPPMVQQIAALRTICLINTSPCRQNRRCGATKVRLTDLLELRQGLFAVACRRSSPLNSYTGVFGPPLQL